MGVKIATNKWCINEVHDDLFFKQTCSAIYGYYQCLFMMCITCTHGRGTWAISLTKWDVLVRDLLLVLLVVFDCFVALLGGPFAKVIQLHHSFHLIWKVLECCPSIPHPCHHWLNNSQVQASCCIGFLLCPPNEAVTVHQNALSLSSRKQMHRIWTSFVFV